MKFLSLLIALATVATAACAQSKFTDRITYGRYAAANAAVTEAPRAVFMGNSITDCWTGESPGFWQSHPDYACRGISGQTTIEMLCRFRQDVIKLRPQMVCILAGINDIAQNDGFISPENTLDNIVMMVELARAHKIKVAVCSITPCDKFPWRDDIEPAPKIAQLNAMLRDYVTGKKDRGVVFVDYHAALDNGRGGLYPADTHDRCHLTAAGYKKLEAVIVPVISRLTK